MSDQSVVIEEITHSHLGASGASRWMNCPGSIRLTNQLDPSKVNKTGSAAAEGTVAHEVAADALEENADAWEYIGNSYEVDGWKFEIDGEMATHIQVYLDFVRGKLKEYPDSILHVERS